MTLERTSPAAQPSPGLRGAGLNLALGTLSFFFCFGAWGLINATTLGGRLWQGVVCHV